MAVEIELRQRTDVKPWYCEVYVGDLPLLDVRGNVVTVTKKEVLEMQYGKDHWVFHMGRAAKDCHAAPLSDHIDFLSLPKP